MRKIISDKSVVLPALSGIKNGASSPGKNKTMPRLKGFNYRRPFFYMVTMKRLANLAANTSASVQKVECSSFRSTRRLTICQLSGSFTVAATKWAISRLRGWKGAIMSNHQNER